MSRLDPTVASLVDTSTKDDPDEDALFAELENDDSTLPALRERRIQQLSEELSRAKAASSRSSGETYQTVKDERTLLDITTSKEDKRCVVHFFHPDFHRCQVMDRHLERLSERHYEVRWCKVDVRDVEWICTKLGVKVLPCVVGFLEGKAVTRVVGFEGLGGDGFSTGRLERLLVEGGVLLRGKMGEDDGGGLGKTKKQQEESEDYDEDDWD